MVGQSRALLFVFKVVSIMWFLPDVESKSAAASGARLSVSDCEVKGTQFDTTCSDPGQGAYLSLAKSILWRIGCMIPEYVLFNSVTF